MGCLSLMEVNAQAMGIHRRHPPLAGFCCHSIEQVDLVLQDSRGLTDRPALPREIQKTVDAASNILSTWTNRDDRRHNKAYGSSEIANQSRTRKK